MWRILIVSCSLIFSALPGYTQSKVFHLSGKAQGTTWHVTYFHNDSVVTVSSVDSLLQVIDSSMSLYKPYSLIVAFNNSSRGIVIDSHFRKVVAKSLEVSARTKGLFDITVGPLVKASGFGVDANDKEAGLIEMDSLLSCVGYNKIRLKDDSLVKSRPCINVDVNGIAQGYSVDVVAAFLDARGLQDYVVEIGGEVRVKGNRQPSGQPFRVSIEVPGDDVYSMGEKLVELRSGALTTSGSYRRYVERAGRRFSHIIDPRTGKSVDNEIISVTVAAPDAITADAYDNALMVMGVKKALRFVRKHRELSVFIVYRDKDGKVRSVGNRKSSLKWKVKN